MGKGLKYCIGLTALIILLFWLNLIMGSIKIPVRDVLAILSGDETIKASWRFIVLQ